MKKWAVLATFSIGATILSGCVTRGPDRLQACLDPANPLTKQFFASPARVKALVGGVGQAGEVQCFWSEVDDFTGFIRSSPAWKACQSQATDCTYVADGYRVLQMGHGRILDVSERAAVQNAVMNNQPDGQPGGQVVWYLIGKFAEGLAMGLGFGLTSGAFSAAAAVPASVLDAPPVGTSKQFAATPVSAHPPMRCTPISVAMIGQVGQAPSYMCR